VGRIKLGIADDHRLMLEAIRCVVADADDIEIVGEATVGSQVLPLIARTNPDVLLLDVRMPEMDGLRCLELIRERHEDVEVVVLSGLDDAATIQSALTRGAVSFVSKQVDPTELVSVVREAASGTVERAVIVPERNGSAPAHDAGLTRGEIRVLEALARGLSNKDIAKELWLTEQTVKFHLTNIYGRLGVANRTEAVRHAYQHGLVGQTLYPGVTSA
jgi:DNA-binding NarL/FixJ family response regulator